MGDENEINTTIYPNYPEGIVGNIILISNNKIIFNGTTEEYINYISHE